MREIAKYNQFNIFSLDRETAEKYADEINKSLDLIPMVEPHTTEALLADTKGERKLHNKWHHSIIALDESGKYAGVVVGYEREAESNEQYPNNCIYLNSIAVSGDFQKQGLGNKLVELWLAYNREIGFMSLDGLLEFAVQTNSAEWNRHVQNLYERNGFEKMASKEYDNRTDNVYRMR